MSDRFIVVTRTGEPIIRTNHPGTAEQYRALVDGTTIDKETAREQHAVRAR